MNMGYSQLLDSIEHICVLITIAYFLSRTRVFARLFSRTISPGERLYVLVFFGLMALVEVVVSGHSSSATPKFVSSTAAGLLAGPVVGLVVGVVSGLLAGMLTGAAAWADGVGALIGGLLGGWVLIFGPKSGQRVVAGFLTGALSYALWLAFMFASDFLVAMSWTTVAVQYFTPVAANGVAVALFLVIVSDMRAQQEHLERAELGRAIAAAQRMLPELANGLTPEAAQQIADKVRQLTDVPAVDIAQFLCNYQAQLAELERQTQAAARAELKALQAQVHPHFLFNTLNTIAGLCELQPERAGALTVKLGEFFRSSFRSDREPKCRLGEELALVRTYLEIEKARFGERLTVIEQIDPDAELCTIPSFALQPLVENAVLHGLAKKTGAGRLKIAVRRRGQRLVCFVADNGKGCSRDPNALVALGNGENHALPMLRRRLQALYGANFGLRIRSLPGNGTVVWLSVPTETDR